MSTGLTGIAIAICITGIASQYAPFVFPRVVATQQRLHHLPMVLPQVDGYIAVLNCGDLGQVWMVNDEKMLASDCAGDSYTRHWMLRGNVLVEVDYLTARRWGTVGRAAQVTVCRRGNEGNKINRQERAW